MEWRQQTSLSCADAFVEAQRWIEEVTGKSFGSKNFRAALENGVLLCDLINQLKPGIIKRVNRLSTPIAGLDNVNVFLKACGKLGLNESQLFHPGDLQDLSTRATLRRDESNRRLKNVLITIYWLGRKAHLDAFYSGPQLHFKAFEGLLGLALSKALDDGGNVFVKDSWYPERDKCLHTRQRNKPENSWDARALRPSSEGCGSDAEAEQGFKMETMQSSVRQIRSYIPQRGVENRGGCASPLARANQIQVRPEKVQVNPGWIWSKSLSDIPMVYPVRDIPNVIIYNVGLDASVTQEWNQEGKHKCSIAAKDSEAQWRDDLTKWKNRRRSVKSELRQRSEDREHVISQMTNGALTDSQKNEAVHPINRDQQSPQQTYPTTSSSLSRPATADFQPRTRALLLHNFATDAPPSCCNVDQVLGAAAKPSDRIIWGEETDFASLASDGVVSPPSDCPFSSPTQVRVSGSSAALQLKPKLAQPGNVGTRQISTLITTIQPNNTAKSSGSRDPAPPVSIHDKLQLCADPRAPVFCSDADTTTKDALEEQQRPSSQETCQMDPGRGHQVPTVYKYLPKSVSWSSSASLPRGYRRSEGSMRLSSALTARPYVTKQSSLPRLCTGDDDQDLLLNDEREKSLLKRQRASAHLTRWYQAGIRQSGTEQTEEVKGTAPYGPTSIQDNGCLHQDPNQLLPRPYAVLQADPSSTSTLPCHGSIRQQKVDHSDIRVNLTLKPNSRPDFGFQTQWDLAGVRVKYIQPGSPADLSQLSVGDKIVAVNGVEVVHMNYTQWKNKMTSSLQNGSLTMDIRRYGNKGCDGVSERNQRRRADFFRQPGGSQSAISDLQVPSLSPSSSSWSWNHEEDRRRQEKWQEEQERLLQEQYQRDQERLEAEWRRAQQDAMGALCIESGAMQMTDGDASPASTQALNGSTIKTREEERVPNRTEQKEVGSKLQRSGQIVQKDETTGRAWADNTCGFAQLSSAHRAKSSSTPALSGPHRQSGGDEKKKRPSKVEQERQQILEEMKKRTQLLTDNSWIRQRSGSIPKEPIHRGAPLKRFESLDNLSSLRQSPVLMSTFNYPRPHSAAAGYCALNRNYSSRYSSGGISPPRNTSLDPSHHDGTSAANEVSEEIRLESRFESKMGSRPASPAFSTSSPPVFDQHAVFQITE